MVNLALVIHDVRSAHNVGSLLRTADGFGVNTVYLTGYTPYPTIENDSRLPHIQQKISRQIEKTALGAQQTLNLVHFADINRCLDHLEQVGFKALALEQTKDAVDLSDFKITGKTALIVGNEISGLNPEILQRVKTHVQLPMLGQKESFNVSVASAIALYHLRWTK